VSVVTSMGDRGSDHPLSLSFNLLLACMDHLPINHRFALPPHCHHRSYTSLREGTRNKQIYVLPAFETARQANETKAHMLADNASGMEKEELQELVQKRLVYQFAMYLFWQGHNSTDYKKWFATDEAYAIKPRSEYEPWFLIDRLRNPFYDSAFRGYGWNKVTHVANVLHQEYTVMVHPAGFLVHRQHGRR